MNIKSSDESVSRFRVSASAGQRGDCCYAVIDRYDQQGGKGMRRVSWHRTAKAAQADARRRNAQTAAQHQAMTERSIPKIQVGDRVYAQRLGNRSFAWYVVDAILPDHIAGMSKWPCVTAHNECSGRRGRTMIFFEVKKVEHNPDWNRLAR